MKNAELPAPKVAPIFLFADDDRAALDRMLSTLHDEWTYIEVTKPRVVVKYAKEIAVTAIFLAAHIHYPRGGAARLLQELLDAVDKPVVILVERWTPETAADWKRQGAADCLPHPTRTIERFSELQGKLATLALAQTALCPWMSQQGS